MINKGNVTQFFKTKNFCRKTTGKNVTEKKFDIEQMKIVS